jgi:uncharacterized membrane protein YkvA (DUF1232 family)
MDNRQFDYYQRLRLKIRQWASKTNESEQEWFEYILATPDLFHLLCKLAVEPEIPIKKRIHLAGAIAYFMSPIDFLPEEIIGPAGYLDDISVAAYILNKLINDVDPKIIQKHWAGDRDVLLLIKSIIANADEMLGAGLWEKIKQKFG